MAYYGNCMNLSPSGHSSGGVRSSEKAVREDLSTLNNHKDWYQSVGRAHGVQPSVIGAIASRESRGGDALQNGYGDNGKAWGILQCDLKHSGLDCKSQGAYSRGHINMMVRDLLRPYIDQVARNHPRWSRDQHLQGGVSAYNRGVSTVTSWEGIDRVTHNGDYSNDIMARAQYLHRVENWD